MTPSSAADTHDAIVDLVPYTEDQWPGFAYGIVKQTFRVADGRCELAAPEPLRHDIRSAELDPRLPLGSDYWIQKPAADVVVLGSAYAPGGRPTEAMEIRCAVGGRTKRIAVTGTRHVEWTRGGRPCVGPAEPFVEMPVCWENAYGGFDARVPVPELDSWQQVVALLTDHPGMYPRNPFGKGYFVVDERFDGIELPNLEDPDDRLTDERLVLGDPERWHRQPLPWTFDWHHPLMFPRYVYLGAEARFPATDDELLEVDRGLLERGCRAAIRRATAGEAPTDRWLRYYQEASLGMVFERLQPGCPIEVVGMHRERSTWRFSLPAPPAIAMEVEGERTPVEPQPSLLVLHPAEERLTVTYVARTKTLPRTFLPGIHRHVPITLRVGDAAPLAYQPPEPFRPPPHDSPREAPLEAPPETGRRRRST